MYSRPPNNIEFVKQLVKRLYNYEVKQIKELNGADDRNYYLVTNHEKEFVLKITNTVEGSVPGLLDAVNSFILFLHNNGFRVSVPQVNTNGKYLSYEEIPSPDGQSVHESPLNTAYGVRLLEFISGKLLRDVPFTPQLLTECGQVLAHMTIAIQTFESQVISKSRPDWSLLNVLAVRQYIDAVQNQEDRDVVSATLDEFERTVMPILDELETNLIHGDFNEMNIIVHKNPNEHPDNEYHVKGVIDFGDIHYAPR
ncbi:unnamed protein product, partial [Oppiella nova]